MKPPLVDVLRQVQRLCWSGDIGTSDRVLLDRFACRNDQDAFATLVGRHCRMVWGVCCRILANGHDAEDAFQATFLVLARRAASLQQPDRLGSWLHGVACRVATKARMQLAQRQARERQACPRGHHRDTPATCADLREILDEEIQHLPEKYRVAVVLCYLQGKSYEEAARLLGWPAGTVSGRLARARQLLRGRLSRRGLESPCPLLPLAQGTEFPFPQWAGMDLGQSVPVPPGLMDRAVAVGVHRVSSRVMALAEGVGKTMFWSKSKLMLVLLLPLGLLGGWVLPGGSTKMEAFGQDQTHSAATKATSQVAGEQRSPSSPRKPAGKMERELLVVAEEKKESPKEDPLKKLEELEQAYLKARQAAIAHLEKQEKQAQAAYDQARKDYFKAARSRDRKKLEQARETMNKALQKVRRISGELRSVRFRRIVGYPWGPREVDRASLLGISAIRPSSTLVAQLNLPREQGMLLRRVSSGSPAAKAGLKTHDVLLQLNNKPVPRDSKAFRALLAELKPGKAVSAVVLRKGKEQTIEGLTLPDRKK